MRLCAGKEFGVAGGRGSSPCTRLRRRRRILAWRRETGREARRAWEVRGFSFALAKKVWGKREPFESRGRAWAGDRLLIIVIRMLYAAALATEPQREQRRRVAKGCVVFLLVALLLAGLPQVAQRAFLRGRTWELKRGLRRGRATRAEYLVRAAFPGAILVELAGLRLL